VCLVRFPVKRGLYRSHRRRKSHQDIERIPTRLNMSWRSRKIVGYHYAPRSRQRVTVNVCAKICRLREGGKVALQLSTFAESEKNSQGRPVPLSNYGTCAAGSVRARWCLQSCRLLSLHCHVCTSHGLVIYKNAIHPGNLGTGMALFRSATRQL